MEGPDREAILPLPLPRYQGSLLALGGRRPAGNATDADPWGHVAEHVRQGFEGDSSGP